MFDPKILLAFSASFMALGFLPAHAAPAPSGKQLWERTVITNAGKPAPAQASEECTVYENWIESIQKQGNSAPVRHQLTELADAAYYRQSLLELQNTEDFYQTGSTGLADAKEYGMLTTSTEPGQEYDLVFIEQMGPDSQLYAKSPRRDEWKKFIDDKCDRARTAPIVPRD